MEHTDPAVNPTNKLESASNEANRTRKVSAAVIAAVVIAAVFAVGCGGGGGGGTNIAQFCKDLDASISLIDATSAGLAPPGKSDLESVAKQMHKLASEAPAEIKGDLNSSAEFFQKASEHGISSVDSATTRAADAAGEHINEFATAHCESVSS